MFSKLGIVFLCLAFIGLGYPLLHAIIGLGHSDKLNVNPPGLIDILGVENFIWINSIPFSLAQKALLFTFKLPLFMLLFAIGGIFFLIHFVAPERG